MAGFDVRNMLIGTGGGGAGALSALVIDASKDMNGKSLTIWPIWR